MTVRPTGGFMGAANFGMDEDPGTVFTAADGRFRIEGLEPGDYSLKIKREGREIPVRVTAGEMIGRFAAGKRRILETANRLPLHVIDIAPDKQGNLLLQLVNADAATRVHVLVARFDPVFPLHGALGPAYQPPIAMLTRPTSQNVYLSGRDIGDEHRYILERREQTPFPGNMLARPGLLLNPWAIRETDTGKQQAATGGEYDDLISAEGGSRSEGRAYGGKGSGAIADPSNLDKVLRRHVGRSALSELDALLTIQDLDVLQAAVDAVHVCEPLCGALAGLVSNLDAELNDAVRECYQKGYLGEKGAARLQKWLWVSRYTQQQTPF